MQCPHCGYILQPFDTACPRCAALARTQQAAAPLPTLPPTGYTSLASYATASRAAAERREKRQVAALMVGCLGLLMVIASVAFFLTSRPSHRSGAGGIAVMPGHAGGDSVFGMVDSFQIDNRLAAQAATTGGDLEVSLAWNTLSDIDLQVSDPFGEQIAANHPRSRSGGVQDVDANPTLLTSAGENRVAAGEAPGAGNVQELPEFLVDLDKKLGLPNGLQDLNLPSNGVKAPPHWTRQPIEHIYFAQAPKGIYTVRVHCYSWRESDAKPLPFTVEIRSHQKVVYRTAGTIGPASYVGDGAPPVEVCRFEHR